MKVRRTATADFFSVRIGSFGSPNTKRQAICQTLLHLALLFRCVFHIRDGSRIADVFDSLNFWRLQFLFRWPFHRLAWNRRFAYASISTSHNMHAGNLLMMSLFMRSIETSRSYVNVCRFFMQMCDTQASTTTTEVNENVTSTSCVAVQSQRARHHPWLRLYLSQVFGNRAHTARRSRCPSPQLLWWCAWRRKANVGHSKRRWW